MGQESLFSKIIIIIPKIKEDIIKIIGITFLYEAIKYIPIILIKYIIDYLVQGHQELTTLVYFIIAIFISYAVLTIMDFFLKRVEFRWIIKYETSILEQAKKKLLELHHSFHEKYNSGAQVSKITKGTHKLSELSWFLFNEFIPTLVQLLITFILLLYEQWLLALIFCIFIPIIISITLYASRKVQPYRQLYHQKFEEAIGELGESITNISTVKDYGQEKHQFEKFNAILEQYKDIGIKRWDYTESKFFWRDLFINFGRVLTLAITASMVLKGTMSAGSLVLIYTLTERAFTSSHRIGRLYSYLEDAMESINRLANLIEEKSLVKDNPKAKSINQLQGNIEFNAVSFSYDSQKPVLKNISFSIKPKQIVAFVGRSGSGKTTIIKLLLRHYDITRGKILIDHQELKSYRLSDYKKRIAIVSQNVEIFNRSILENIRFANPKATREEVIQAAKKSHAHEFIKEFPEQYNTIVGEKGVKLSGGQKQRLSIARSFLKDPDIYIFDEATSSLDSQSEQYIQKSIFEVAGRKTTIIIAHRLSTIKKADLIIVLDKGEIKEQGTYSKLIKENGLFAKMIKLQNIENFRD